jgi:hypothetical protein
MDAADTADLQARRKPSAWRLPLFAAVFAAGALILAVVSSLAIEQIRTTYTWGIPEAPQEDGAWRPVPSTGEFTPLLLAAPPFQWDVRWSCRIDRPNGGEPLEVFGSIVHDEFGPGLRVTLLDDTFEVVVGGDAVTSIPVLPDAAPECVYRFTLDDEGAWSLLTGEQALDAGSIDELPRLNGFGSGLGGDVSGSVGVVVTTQRFGATASTGVRLMQIAAVVLGAIAVCCLVWWWRLEDREAVG